jgi:uncharacterized membrane protein
MATLVFAVNPIIATIGQIAAIIICLFVFIFVLVALAFNLAMAFGLGWVRDKANLIKMLRPVVESVNKASDGAVHGGDPEENQNVVVRTVATVPMQMNAIDKKVEQTSDRVANVAIEVRARVEQGKAIARAFFRPTRREPSSQLDGQSIGDKSPAYKKVNPEEIVVAPTKKGASNGYQRDDAGQLKDVSAR